MEKNADTLENSVLVCEEALWANICWVLELLCQYNNTRVCTEEQVNKMVPTSKKLTV